MVDDEVRLLIPGTLTLPMVSRKTVVYSVWLMARVNRAE